MSLMQFLKEYIEQYLLSDLRNMVTFEKTIDVGHDGHLAYPLFISCAAGIETLGVLLTETGDDFAESGASGFDHYWRTYLYKNVPECNVARNVYTLVRNGIAHNFAAKLPTIGTRMPDRHLKVVDGVPYIDATKLASDFEWSYDQFKKDVKDNKELRRRLEDTFERFVAYNENKVEKNRSALDKLQVFKPKAPDMNPDGATDVKPNPTGSLFTGGASSKGIG